MATLAADAPRAYQLGERDDYPVIASDIIYEGAAVGDNASGYARPLVAADPFRGFAIETADNSAGSAGDINVRVIRKGQIKLAVASVAITDVGRPVFASDDATFSLVGVGTFIGYVARWISSGVCIVTFDANIQPRYTTLDLPVTLAGVTAADVMTTLTPGFNGWVKSVEAIVTTAATTAAKAASFNLEIGTTNLTGGVVALTSANATPLGAIVASTAITAGNSFTATDTLSVEAASVTAFVEGAIVLRVTLGQ